MIRIGTISIALRCIALSLSAALALPSIAQAACTKWDMSGDWTVDQANGFRVVFFLTQTGNTITGRANYGLHQYEQSKSLTGSVSDSNRVTIKVEWNTGAVAVYTGSLDSRGHWGPGTTYDKTNYASPSSWRMVNHNQVWGNIPATCVAEAAPPPSAPASPPSSGPWSAVAADGNGHWGYALSQPSKDVAGSAALQGCGDSACKILDALQAQCVAYAESRQGGDWYFAYLGPDLMTVQSNALNACMKAAPVGSCKLVKARCS